MLRLGPIAATGRCWRAPLPGELVRGAVPIFASAAESRSFAWPSHRSHGRVSRRTHSCGGFGLRGADRVGLRPPGPGLIACARMPELFPSGSICRHPAQGRRPSRLRAALAEILTIVREAADDASARRRRRTAAQMLAGSDSHQRRCTRRRLCDLVLVVSGLGATWSDCGRDLDGSPTSHLGATVLRLR